MQPSAMDGRHADPASLHGATLLGRYRIEALIGQGGMALVYAGRHLALEREVAIKVLRHQHARRQTVVDRFLQEARAASRVRHDHIAEVTDFGSTPDGIVFMVMERLFGETLAETIERDGRMPWPRARDIALQLCDALQIAHDHDVVHRDVSLKNCFRMSRGRNPDFMKLLDFGIARVIGSETSPNGPLRRLTGDTQIMGTPEFMSPEQATRSCAVDWRSDVYSMGVVLYAMLTEQLPFQAATAVDLMARHIYDPVPPPSQHEPTLAPAVEAIVLRALEKDPDRRFQSMTELADALRTVPDDARRELSSRPSGPEFAESSTSVLVSSGVPVVERPPSRSRAAGRFALAGAAVGLAWLGWQYGDRNAIGQLYEAVSTLDDDSNDTMVLPAGSGPVAPPMPAAAPADAAIVTASAVAADPIEPRTMRAAIVPPAPPLGSLDRPRATVKRAGPVADARLAAARSEPEPPPIVAQGEATIEPATPLEPTPATVRDPMQQIDEVKNPFEQ